MDFVTCLDIIAIFLAIFTLMGMGFEMFSSSRKEKEQKKWDARHPTYWKYLQLYGEAHTKTIELLGKRDVIRLRIDRNMKTLPYYRQESVRREELLLEIENDKKLYEDTESEHTAAIAEEEKLQLLCREWKVKEG